MAFMVSPISKGCRAGRRMSGGLAAVRRGPRSAGDSGSAGHDRDAAAGIDGDTGDRCGLAAQAGADLCDDLRIPDVAAQVGPADDAAGIRVERDVLVEEPTQVADRVRDLEVVA